MLHIVNRSVDDFPQIVRRYIGRHADRDADRTVDKQIREAGGQHLRLFQTVIKVRIKVYDVFVNIRHHFIGKL